MNTYVYHEDLPLKQRFGGMLEAWCTDTHCTDARVLSQDCLHDLLTNCAWWEEKMKATYRQYEEQSRLPVVPMRGDLLEVHDDRYRIVGN